MAICLLAGVVVVLGALAAALGLSHGSLTADPQALAKVGMPFGGGTVQSAVAVAGRDNRPLAIELRDGKIWPKKAVAAGQRVTIDVVIERPGSVAWLTGSTEHLRLSLITPSSSLAESYLTLRSGAPITVRFTQPVSVIWSGATPAVLRRRVLGGASREVSLPRSAAAGSMWVAATPRTWESAKPQPLSWFPAGAVTAAVATPAPGGTIKPSTPIVLTFSKPVTQALGSSMPPVFPATPGTWHVVNSHSIIFRPLGYGYGLGAHVTVALPRGVQLVGGRASNSSDIGSWNVPPGSTVRLQQLLAILGYLPLSFSYTGARPAPSPTGEETAALSPPAGTFSWRWGDVPGTLRGMWQPGASGPITKGAVMAFENDHGMMPDGVAGPVVWKALMAAALAHRASTFGFSFVAVDQSNETLNLWHNGRTILTTPVNTGVSGAPTANGTFNVFEHIPSGTMSGTNADGSHYVDPGIPWISYFNGGDALHGFVRASYGSPQSDGCVEMPIPTAARVWPYTPIGTIVNVS